MKRAMWFVCFCFCFSHPSLAQMLDKTTAIGTKAVFYNYRCPAPSAQCIAQCRANETLISGGCAIASGGGALQNAWMGIGGNGDPAFFCNYGAPADIFAQAICLK
jgi:hypothetical protein